jgi:hypothetical protein
MADVKISQLPAATTPVDGTEVLPIVQSATTKQVSIANLTAGRAMSASSMTLTNPLAVTSGGTGIATAAEGALLSATAANTFSATRTPTLGLAGTAAGTLGLSGSTSGVVTLATAAAAGTWTFTLPTSGGSNGWILTTNGSGVSTWTNPTALGVDLDVGTTAITGGTAGRVLYNNAGVLGEYAITGTGSVVLGTSPTFTTSAIFPAGTVGAPSITTTGDTNTGIYFPAADTIGFVEGGVESMRLDASGNLGIATTSPAYKLDVAGTVRGRGDFYFGFVNGSQAGVWWSQSNYAAPAFQGLTSAGNVGDIILQPGGGNVGIGTSSPGNYGKLAVYAASGYNAIAVISGSSEYRWYANSSGDGGFQSVTSGQPLLFMTNGGGGTTERARIDSSGNLLVGTTTQLYTVGAGSFANFNTGGANVFPGWFRNSNSTSPVGIAIAYSAASPNNASQEFIYAADSTAVRFAVRSNGGIANYSGNDANLSDARLKTNINDAGSYLQKICAIPVRTFKYKGQTHDDLTLGVIAQEVEAVAPELVDNDGFGKTPEDGVPYKAIYQTDLQYALMKCIQELAVKVTALEEQLNA